MTDVEELRARVAMLVEALACRHAPGKPCALVVGLSERSWCIACRALAVTAPDVEKWLAERDARAWKAAMKEAARIVDAFDRGNYGLLTGEQRRLGARDAIRALAAAPATQVHPPGQPGDIATVGASGDGRPGAPSALAAAQEGAASASKAPVCNRCWGRGHIYWRESEHGVVEHQPCPVCTEAPVCATRGGEGVERNSLDFTIGPCPACTKPEGA